MHKIKQFLMDELYEIEDEVMRSGGSLSPDDVEYIHLLTDTVKNICKIEADEGGYSEEDSSSYARGRGRYAKRDSMGRYSREGGGGSSSDGGSSYGGGSSYRRGGYSRTDGKEHMVKKMREMMESASSEEERRAIHQCIEKLENS